jgi:hypothetical protein
MNTKTITYAQHSNVAVTGTRLLPLPRFVQPLPDDADTSIMTETLVESVVNQQDSDGPLTKCVRRVTLLDVFIGLGRSLRVLNLMRRDLIALYPVKKRSVITETVFIGWGRLLRVLNLIGDFIAPYPVKKKG